MGATRVGFAAGETAKSVSVTVNGDTTVEPAESFYVKLAAPGAGTAIADGTGRGTITNDDYSSTFSVDDVSVVEGFPGGGIVTAAFTITRSAPATRRSDGPRRTAQPRAAATTRAAPGPPPSASGVVTRPRR